MDEIHPEIKGEMMTEKDFGTLEAIEIAMKAELEAANFYHDIIEWVESDAAKDMLSQLVEFEHLHYEKLKELQESLQGGGDWIVYEGKEYQVPKSVQDARGTVGSQKDELLDVISTAIKSETAAKERYEELASKIESPQGQAMFKRLAHEEEMHWRILNDEYYNILNHGKWGF